MLNILPASTHIDADQMSPLHAADPSNSSFENEAPAKTGARHLRTLEEATYTVNKIEGETLPRRPAAGR